MLLEIGDGVRYRGVGAGRVVDHVTRDFRGEQRLFAVIHFPHRSMKAQVPIGDPAITAKLSPVLSARAARRLIKDIALTTGPALSRTWDQREEMGEHVLRNGEPADWTSLLAAYATAASHGVAVAASDAEIVRSATELLAAELAMACGEDFGMALASVEATYDKAAMPRKGAKAEHFAAVSVVAA